MTWVILGHTFLQTFQLTNFTARNVAPAFMLLRYRNRLNSTPLNHKFPFSGSQGLAFEAVLNAFPSVDSFFLMGGVLTAYIVFRELEKAGSNVPR